MRPSLRGFQAPEIGNEEAALAGLPRAGAAGWGRLGQSQRRGSGRCGLGKTSGRGQAPGACWRPPDAPLQCSPPPREPLWCYLHWEGWRGVPAARGLTCPPRKRRRCGSQRPSAAPTGLRAARGSGPCSSARGTARRFPAPRTAARCAPSRPPAAPLACWGAGAGL